MQARRRRVAGALAIVWPHRRRANVVAILLLAGSGHAWAQAVLTEGTNLSPDISPQDGRIAFELLGSLWTMPERGGQASELRGTALPAHAPRWSPDGHQLLYESSGSNGNTLWLHELESQEPRLLSVTGASDQSASWHPDGERIVFASSPDGSELDLWELDLATSLRWRITSRPGDETDPAWSADGRELVYVSHDGDSWRLMLRRHGLPDSELLASDTAIRSPSWRPDGSLVTYLAANGDGYTLDMVILADPPLTRSYSSEESDLFVSPVSWRDRQRMIYAADGTVVARDFDDRRATPVHFRAVLDRSYAGVESAAVSRSLPVITPPSGKFVIRASRVFDGVGHRYLENIDVVTNGARIETLSARREWPDAILIDLGNATIMPGFIDVYSRLAAGDPARLGANLLAYGVTTLVADAPVAGLDETAWHGADTPGPRLLAASDIYAVPHDGSADPILATLAADTVLDGEPQSGTPSKTLIRELQSRGVPVLAKNWTVGLGLGVDLLLGADALPASPGVHQYQDMRFASSGGQIVLVSGLADGGTPGLSNLLGSRQAQHFGNKGPAVRRFASPPRLGAAGTAVILGSRPNGLPAGLALHAELRALSAAGLSGGQVLQAAGAGAARALHLDGQIGSLTPGSLADLVIVAGDPLADVADTLKIVGVVRNGRFFSLINLLERGDISVE